MKILLSVFCNCWLLSLGVCSQIYNHEHFSHFNEINNPSILALGRHTAKTSVSQVGTPFSSNFSQTDFLRSSKHHVIHYCTESTKGKFKVLLTGKVLDIENPVH